MIRLVVLLTAFALSSAYAASAPPDPHTPDRVGIEASGPSTRQPGGYNNYCQTWQDSRAKDRALFGACLSP